MKETIEKLESLQMNYEEIKKCLLAYDEASLPCGEAPPQPKIGSWGFQNPNAPPTETDDLSSLLILDYDDEDDDEDDDEEDDDEDDAESDRLNKDVPVQFTEKECEMLGRGEFEFAEFVPDLFVDKSVAPVLKNLQKPTAPVAPSVFSEISGWISLLLTGLFLALAIVMLVNLCQGYSKMDYAEGEVILANQEYAQVEELFTDPQYLSWKNIWVENLGINAIVDGWPEVEKSWEKEGYSVTTAELVSVMDSKKNIAGMIRLDSVEEGLFAFVLQEKTIFDGDVVTRDGGEYIVRATVKDDIEFWRPAQWTLMFIFFAAVIVLFLYRTGGGKKGIVFCILFALTYPIRYYQHTKKQKEYDKAKSDWFNNVQAAKEEHELEIAKHEEEIEEARSRHNKRQEEIKQTYEAECEAELSDYPPIYAQYLARKKVYEEACLKEKNALSKKYKAIAKQIHDYTDLPMKYGDIIKASIEELGDNKMSYYYKHILSTHSQVIAVIEILKEGRADTIKDAINIYVADEKKERELRILEEAEEERTRILEEEAEWERQHQEQMQFQAAQEAQRMHAEQIQSVKAAANAVIDAQIADLEVRRSMAERKKIFSPAAQKDFEAAREERDLRDQISKLKDKKQ